MAHRRGSEIVSRQWVVIAEAKADFVLVTELADRVLVEKIDWLETVHLDSSREWIDHENDEDALTWAVISNKANAAGIRVRGNFGQGTISSDARATRRALIYIRQRFPAVDAIVLSRDIDDDPERLEGMQQAIRSHSAGISAVIAAANPKREAWVLCGFDPRDADEQLRLAECRQQLGCDPREKSQTLTARGAQDLRNAKRVLGILTDSNLDRESACWRETALDTLRQRGQENGLADYLTDVQEKLVPQVGWAGAEKK